MAFATWQRTRHWWNFETLCLRPAAPERGYIWVTGRHSKGRRSRVPSRIEKGIQDLKVAGCTGLEPVRTELSVTGLPVVFTDLPLKTARQACVDRSCSGLPGVDSSRFQQIPTRPSSTCTCVTALRSESSFGSNGGRQAPECFRAGTVALPRRRLPVRTRCSPPTPSRPGALERPGLRTPSSPSGSGPSLNSSPLPPADDSPRYA
jgi:hypothetical protein